MLRVVYACSGCADLGEVADLVSRSLRKTGFAHKQKSCLAGIGLGISGFVDFAREADQVLAIDGCEVACARRTLENASMKPSSFILTEMGLVKGSTPPSPELVQNICSRVVAAF